MEATQNRPLTNNPYNLSHYKLLKSYQRELHDVLPLIDAADRCGMECNDLRGVVQGMSEVLLQIESEFFTPPPLR